MLSMPYERFLMSIFSALKLENVPFVQWVSKGFSVLNPGAFYIYTYGRYRFKYSQEKTESSSSRVRRCELCGWGHVHRSLLLVTGAVWRSGLWD